MMIHLHPLILLTIIRHFPQLNLPKIGTFASRTSKIQSKKGIRSVPQIQISANKSVAVLPRVCRSGP